MLFFIVLSVMTYLLPVTCQTNQQCSLEVTNKKSFETEILDYVREDSTFVLIEYNLTISSNGSIADWNNITDSTSIEPWKWYRAKSHSIIRLIFLYNIFTPTKILFYPTVNTIPVYVIDKPDGCLRNIDIINMTTFIRNTIIEDFYIPFEDLRTTSKVYKNADVCTSRKDEQSQDKYLWCCRHDLHNEIVCEAIEENNTRFVIIQVFVSIVIWISYLYSPYLLHVDTIRRETQRRVFENDMEQERTCKLQMSFYYQQEQPLPFGLIHFIKTNCCSCLTKKEHSSKLSCCCKTENNGSVCCKVLFRLFIYIVFFFFPLILIAAFVFQNSSNLASTIIIAIIGIPFVVLVTVFFIVIVSVDAMDSDEISKSFYNFPEEIKSNWVVQSKCDKALLIFNFFLKSPIVTIIYSLEKCDNVNTNDSKCKKSCKSCCNKVFPIIILILTLPIVVLSNLFVICVAVFMYQAPFMYPILSGVAAFQLYMRDASKTIRRKYERCLKFVIKKIEEHSLTAHSVEDETLLHFYKGKLAAIHCYEDVLYVQGCIPFIIEDSKIYVKETVLSHFMQYRIEKVIVFVAIVTTFMISVVLLVVYIGSFEYISSSNQMFITFITGVIPLLIKIGYSGASNDGDIFLDKEEFEKNLNSYKEQFNLVSCDTNNSQQQVDRQEADSNLQEIAIVSNNENIRLIALKEKKSSTRYNALPENA